MERLIEDIFSDKKVVVITGAGISTLSGARDFRGNDGLYTNGVNVERLLTHSYVMQHPEEFYEFYSTQMMFDDLEPNIVHKVLAKLEEKNLIEGIITQNVDMLHEKAGSKNVINLHGDGDKFYCTKCYTPYTSDDFINYHGQCNCDCCNGFIRPDIVMYDEALDRRRYWDALRLVSSADVLLVLGSSLTVTDIQSFLNQFTHADDPDNILYIVNNKPTRYDSYANMYGATYKDLGEVFERIDEEIKNREPKQLVKNENN